MSPHFESTQGSSSLVRVLSILLSIGLISSFSNAPTCLAQETPAAVGSSNGGKSKPESKPESKTKPADKITVELETCRIRRKYNDFDVKSSSQLVRRGEVKVGDETFRIYLPKTKRGYRLKTKGLDPMGMVSYNSTYLAVDQNHDGKIDINESYFAEFPLRLGDTMYDILSIADDGSRMVLRPNAGPLSGAVIGRRAPEFMFETIDGKKLRNSDFAGKTLIVDCWAPS